MATNQRVESMDYRVELLSPAASPHNLVETENDPPWQLSLDMFKLPADRDLGKSNVLGLRKRWKIEAYYKRQEDIIQGLNELQPSDVPGSSSATSIQDEAMRIARGERTAITVSNVANVILLAAKIYASVETRSMAVIASTLDSLLDVLSGFILWFTAHAMKKPNPEKYPVGKTRMQPVGIVVFASVMAAFGLQVRFGRHYFVEVDIVLPGDMLLSQAHNIGDSLQDKLEQLPEVERAFVHVDHECTHKPEHQQKTNKPISST